MLRLKSITKDYEATGQVVHALKGVDLCFRANEFVSVLGSSGCGKTTLLNIIGGLDHYTSGDLVICGKSTKDYKDSDWDVYRNHRIGFVFQSYNLIQHQTILENVEIALTIAGVSKSERKQRAKAALERVGLGGELRKKPNQLSGGQMQRVAIARALVNNPEILLADEPTGALDSETSVQIMELIREIAGERLVIMVTHNPELAERYSTRIVRLQDGSVVSDSNPYAPENELAECDSADEQRREAACGATTTVKNENVIPLKLLNRRKIAVCILLSIVTLGIYQIYWLYLLVKNTRLLKKSESGCVVEMLCLIFVPFYPLYWWFTRGKMMKEKFAEYGSSSIGNENAYLILGIFGLSIISMAIMQNDFNSFYPVRERSSMSFKTSLGLSARNLAMKKGRTIITSIAGSIGIISVCLVLALSNGFNRYILKTEEDMLSHYPLQIAETSMDAESILSNLQSRKDFPDLSKIGDKVYVNSFLTGIAQGMQVTNNLSDEYIAYVEKMDKSLYTAISYDYGESLLDNLFTEVKLGEGDDAKASILSLSQIKKTYTDKLTSLGGDNAQYAKLAPMVDYLGSVVHKMPGTSDFSNERYAEYVRSQYDVVYGGENAFPKAANEAVIVVGSNNDVTDLTLAQLGFIDEETFVGLFDGNKGEDERYYLNFADVVQKEFTLYYNDAVYEEMPDGETYAFKYNGERASLNVENGQGVKLKITGILRLKEGLSYGCLSTGLNVTEKLVEDYIAVNKQSKIVQWINSPENYKEMDYNGMHLRLHDLPAEHLSDYYTYTIMGLKKSYDISSVLRMLGGDDSVSKISLYTESFETKEGMMAYLDEWNDTHEKAAQVQYTDVVGMMMGMVQTMLGAITYVLVAFTSISLVVSSVMIGIITYVSVVERVKEIGILRSLGARKRDIKNLFNAETFIIGLTSGVFGVVVTYLLSIGVNALLNALTGIATLAALPISSALIMICISIALTLISGLIPAGAAAKKDPVVALRTE